jgi:hypothetical protein
MTRSDDLYTLPAGLPVPVDDGACDVTLVLRGGIIEKAFYPVFPPDRNAEQVAQWLREVAERFRLG